MRTQIDDIIIIIIIIIINYIFFIFLFKPRFHQQIILQISRYTFLNSNLIPHRTNINVLVKNNSNK
jgi:hypothetical protein